MSISERMIHLQLSNASAMSYSHFCNPLLQHIPKPVGCIVGSLLVCASGTGKGCSGLKLQVSESPVGFSDRWIIMDYPTVSNQWIYGIHLVILTFLWRGRQKATSSAIRSQGETFAVCLRDSAFYEERWFEKLGWLLLTLAAIYCRALLLHLQIYFKSFECCRWW